MQHPEFHSIPKIGLEYLLMIEAREPEWEPHAEYGVRSPGQWVRQYSDQRFALDLHHHRMLHLEHTVPLDTTIEELKYLIDELTA